jgi:hypothetical protein
MAAPADLAAAALRARRIHEIDSTAVALICRRMGGGRLGG